MSSVYHRMKTARNALQSICDAETAYVSRLYGERRIRAESDLVKLKEAAEDLERLTAMILDVLLNE